MVENTSTASLCLYPDVSYRKTCYLLVSLILKLCLWFSVGLYVYTVFAYFLCCKCFLLISLWKRKCKDMIEFAVFVWLYKGVEVSQNVQYALVSTENNELKMYLSWVFAFLGLSECF